MRALRRVHLSFVGLVRQVRNCLRRLQIACYLPTRWDICAAVEMECFAVVVMETNP